MLRARRRAHVAALGPEGRAAAEAALAERLGAIARTGAVTGYLAAGAELSVLPALEALAHAGAATAIPLLGDGDAAMRFAAWRPGDPLEEGPFGLRQPLAHAPTVEPALILAPLLGFDRHGGRLGQGQGFYDRAFARHPGARRIGVAWSVQEIEEVPMDPWDEPLSAVITEQGWIDGEAQR